MASDILIVDDEADIRELVAGILDDEGHETRMAACSDTALQAIKDRVPRLVFLDIWIQNSKLDGLALLDEIKRVHPDLPVIMISGHGNIETAVSAIRRGAYDYLEKPFKADKLVLLAERALETSKLKREVSDLKKRAGDSTELIGQSVAMTKLRAEIGRVAPTNSRVMLQGPTGCGKERVARAMHEQSLRANGPFVAVNAASITPERMELELFGSENQRTGERVVGALEEAHGGILFIDEVADMPLETQGKILRVLVAQQFMRLGGTEKVKVDVRILSSTAHDLSERIEDGLFRQDLYDRLAVVPLKVPSLEERREDIPYLIDEFMHQIGKQTGIRPPVVADDAMAVLQSHAWPGNVRQLRNAVERLMIMSRDTAGEPITSEKLPSEIQEDMPRTPANSDQHIMSMPLREAREVFEREYLSAQIGRFGGNISRTAEFIGMERSALHRKLKTLGV